MTYSVEVTVKGPLFDGRLERGIAQGLEDGLDQVAKDGVNLVRQRLAGVLRHPTGRYESVIQTDRAGASRVITDGGIVYGPWLEGVSTRNRTTRFAGYATFRRTTAEVDRRAGDIVERAISDRIGSM
jgi:hypothetical protein